MVSVNRQCRLIARPTGVAQAEHFAQVVPYKRPQRFVAALVQHIVCHAAGLLIRHLSRGWMLLTAGPRTGGGIAQRE